MKKSLTIRNDGFEGFRKRSLERASKLDRGELLEPEKIITFDEAFRALTPARILVIRKAKEKKSVLHLSLTASIGPVRRSVAMWQPLDLSYSKGPERNKPGSW